MHDETQGTGPRARRAARARTRRRRATRSPTLPVGRIRPGKYQPRTQHGPAGARRARRLDHVAGRDAADARAPGRPRAATRSSPASGAGAQRSMAGLERGSGAGARGARRSGARAVADREHPARRPESARGGARHPAPDRRIQHDARAGGRRGGPLARRRHQPAAPARARASRCRRWCMEGALDMGHARALLALDGARQIEAAHRIAAKGLSVRETEALVQSPGARPRRTEARAQSRPRPRAPGGGARPSASAPRWRSAPRRRAAASWWCTTRAWSISTQLLAKLK